MRKLVLLGVMVLGFECATVTVGQGQDVGILQAAGIWNGRWWEGLNRVSKALYVQGLDDGIKVAIGYMNSTADEDAIVKPTRQEDS
jgi:hypothetical protein